MVGECAAPIIKYMRNWSEEKILKYCAAKGWRGVKMSEDRKKYDSQCGIWAQNARLAKEPQIIEGGEKPMVKLTFPLDSRSERHDTAWWELTVNDRQSDMASYLEPGDVIGWSAFPAIRKWGDDKKNTSLEGVRAELYPSIDLLVTLKERGWTPGSGGMKKKGKAKAAPKKGKPAPKKQVQDLDDEDLTDEE